MANRQVAVVTGSGRGFGLVLAHSLLKAGYCVVVSARSQASVDRALAELAAYGERLRAVRCDVTAAAEVEALSAEALRVFGRLDVWVNNAAYAAPAATLADLPLAEASSVVATNILGTLFGVKAALDHMVPARRGTIVNLYGRGDDMHATPITGAYAASKAWARSFTRTLQSELRGSGVRVLGFNPGLMLTDMTLRPTVIGSQAVRAMRVFPTVVRLLADQPHVAAERLVRRLGNPSHHPGELRMQGLLSMLRKLPRLIAQRTPATPAAMGAFPTRMNE